MGGGFTWRLGAGGVALVATPHPAEANVKLLTYGKGTDAGQFVADHSLIFRDLTCNGNAQIDTGVSLDGTSLLFDGSGDYISAAHTSDLSVGNATDFCIEAEVYVTSAAINVIAAKRTAGGGGYWLYVDASGFLVFQTITSANVSAGSATSSSALSASTKYHVAGSRQGSTLRVFVNGVLAGTGTQSGTASDNSTQLQIGFYNQPASSYFNGNINYLRLTSGEALYTQSFVSPTGPADFLTCSNGRLGDVTFNPFDVAANLSIVAGHTVATCAAGGAWKSVRATKGIAHTAKGYFEMVIGTATTSNAFVGVGTGSASLTNFCGGDANGWGYFAASGNTYTNGANTAYGSTYGTLLDVIGVAFDNGKVWFAKNNVWQNSGNPAAGTGAAYTGITGTIYPMISLFDNTKSMSAHFYENLNTYTPPSGFPVWEDA